MPEYLSPGVYIEEVNTGPVPIEAVSTSTAGFVGMTERGPAAGPPILVTSFAEYTRIFGGYLPEALGDKRFLTPAVKGFFDNGGQRLYVKRVVASATGGAIAKAQRLPPPVKSEKPASGGTSEKPASGGTSDKPEASSASDKAGAAGSANDQPAASSATVDIAGQSVTINAINVGNWGNDLVLKLSRVSMIRRKVDKPRIVKNNVDNDSIQLDSAAGFYSGALLEFDTGGTKTYNQIASINGHTIVLATPLSSANVLQPHTTISTLEFNLIVTYKHTVENHTFLALSDLTPNYFVDQINNTSQLINVSSLEKPLAITRDKNPLTFPSPPDSLPVKLSGGGDGTPTYDDYIGNGEWPGKRTGIQALEDIDEISIVAAPGITDQSVINALLIHCAQLKYRFAIVDPDYADDPNPLEDIKAQRGNYDSQYAALYFPRVLVNNPFKPGKIAIPPSGHMAGIYARVDNDRGVYKAPANEVIMGILGLDLLINKREQDILNPPPHQINVLRDFSVEGRGLRVWGARCITSDSTWKYISVRRLFIFIEKSLDRGTQWVVFEPNDYTLWKRVIQSVSAFLTTIWRGGALLGEKASDAFYVTCGLGTTMTQDDIDNGRLVLEVGIAPVKPAEFVIIRISQTATGAGTNP